MKTILLAAMLVSQSASTPSLAALQFLAGEWQAVGMAAGEEGGFTFRFAVQDHVLIRDNHATYAATAGRAASRHDDLMVVFVADDALKAHYFDNEGHTIDYDVRLRGDRDVVFVSASNASEPGYRLSYVQDTGGLLKGEFEVRAPGSNAFKTYLTWTARRLH